jgi:hypothetical protein
MSIYDPDADHPDADPDADEEAVVDGTYLLHGHGASDSRGRT